MTSGRVHPHLKTPFATAVSSGPVACYPDHTLQGRDNRFVRRAAAAPGRRSKSRTGRSRLMEPWQDLAREHISLFALAEECLLHSREFPQSLKGFLKPEPDPVIRCAADELARCGTKLPSSCGTRMSASSESRRGMAV
jgi:hypothetical protein